MVKVGFSGIQFHWWTYKYLIVRIMNGLKYDWNQVGTREPNIVHEVTKVPNSI